MIQHIFTTYFIDMQVQHPKVTEKNIVHEFDGVRKGGLIIQKHPFAFLFIGVNRVYPIRKGEGNYQKVR